MKRTTLNQAKAALAQALATGRVVVRRHATEDKGGLRTFSEIEIRAELKVASASGDVALDRGTPGRFLAYGIQVTIAFEVQAPNIVVVTVFFQGG